MNIQEKLKQAIRTVPDFPKEGISFKDISGIFQNPRLSKLIINEFADRAENKVDVVCGIESRGFIFGFPIALALNVPFVLVRKKGKLPPPTFSVAYDLEYGQAELEVVQGQIPSGSRVMIHDDVLATGGTANACAKLVEQSGGIVTQYSFLIELLALNGREKIKDTELISLLTY